ncbi:MAG: discoidin domain-containing protein [Dysgonamonadaceae bacterium]|jgi:hypothetical protein|nr:discoidin domain-containing protein [Dysgonamonadaceae bacterium]
MLPESQISFSCSYKYAKTLPNGSEDKGVQPNYSLKLDYSKSHYDLNDLLGFLAQIDTSFKYEPEISPQEGVKIAVKSASASCFQEGENIDKALDGNLNTPYHSPWNEKINYPVILTFDFDGLSQIDYFKYYPPIDKLANGLFGEVEIWASTQTDTVLKKIDLYDFYQSTDPGYYRFPQPVKEPLKIELRILSSMSWMGENHVSCAEIAFYGKP